MRKRYPITERFVTTLANLHYIAPEDTISVHTFFDMLTNLQDRAYRKSEATQYDEEQWNVITHGLLAIGLQDAERIQRIQQCTGSNYEKLALLFGNENRQINRLTRNLWRTRCAYMALPLSWSGLIGGHPVLSTAEYKEEWSELTQIADEVLRTAKLNKIKAQEVDMFILKLWGQSEPLNEITCNDLAKRTRSVIEMNGLYDESDFDL